MNRDAIERLTLARKIENSAALEEQLGSHIGTRPMLAILLLAKEQAAEAMRGLIYVDPNDAKKVREFQHEVRRYDDLVAWTFQIITEGREADARLDELERLELLEIATSPEVQEERDALRGDRVQED